MTTPLHWQMLTDGHTGRLAIRGEFVAATTLDRLNVWHDAVPLAQAQSPVRAPGWPVLTAQAVHWGPGYWSAEAGYQPAAALLALCEHGQRVPHCWAWGDDGERVLVSLAGPHLENDGLGAEALIADRTGTHLTSLGRGPGAVAAACCLGRQLAVVGSARASVHDLDGRLHHQLDNPTPALRIELCAREQRLLLVESGRLSLYRADDGTLLSRSEGRWIDASAAPDGSRVLAVDVEGRLALLDTLALDAAPTWLTVDDPVQSVAADENQIVAAFVRGAPLRRAAWPAR